MGTGHDLIKHWWNQRSGDAFKHTPVNDEEADYLQGTLREQAEFGFLRSCKYVFLTANVDGLLIHNLLELTICGKQ